PASLTSWSIGCGLIALIAGQIGNWLHGRNEMLAERTDHLQNRHERSARSARSQHVLQLSHATLEKRLVSGPSSLAGAIDAAQRRIAERHSVHELGQVWLDVLATQCHLLADMLYV